ncbi:hemolysin XhlA family protein [Vibrio fluvialis]|nr:hemolysin XhlA family protein [Vibrio fluvialis]
MKNNVTSFPGNHFGNKSGNGGGDGLEARVAKLESSVEYIQRDIADIKTDIKEIRHNQRSDFRTLFGALISVALGLAALMAKGFGWL